MPLPVMFIFFCKPSSTFSLITLLVSCLTRWYLSTLPCCVVLKRIIRYRKRDLNDKFSGFFDTHFCYVFSTRIHVEQKWWHPGDFTLFLYRFSIPNYKLLTASTKDVSSRKNSLIIDSSTRTMDNSKWQKLRTALPTGLLHATLVKLRFKSRWR